MRPAAVRPIEPNLQVDWIKARIEGGHYINDGEYKRDLIRREQERGPEIEEVRAALIQGEKSRRPGRFDANAFKLKLRRIAEYRLFPAAERYADWLTTALRALAESPQSAPACDPVRHGYRRRNVERYSICF